MKTVLQSKLPAGLWGDSAAVRLPGIRPLELADWLWVDDVFGAQMALRDELILDRAEDVLALDRGASDAAGELLDFVLTALGRLDGFAVSDIEVHRPDGVVVGLSWDDPLATAGRLIQQDLCLMQPIDGQHVLTGAVLCFPAGWTLREKMLRPLLSIHGPVPSYTEDVARRVHRLFDAIRVEQPLWRLNGFFYDDPALFAPFTEAKPRPKLPDWAPFFRAERQCLLRLPKSNAVVFSIHTFVVARANLSDVQRRVIEIQLAGKSVD